MRKERCGDCYYWDRWWDHLKEEYGERDMGHCHRNPPVVDRENLEEGDVLGEPGIDEGSFYVFPTTPDKEWCGEFKQKTSTEPAAPTV